MTAEETILLDLDEKTWDEQLDRAAAWFGNLLMTQTAFRKLAESAAEKIEEPHIRQYLREVAEKAKEHEAKAEELCRVIGREPSAARKLGGKLMAKGQELVADVVGLVGGARGGWKDIRQLLLTSVDSMGAFAVAEQIGYALGIPSVSDIAFPIGLEKATEQLLLKEYLLEMGPVAILYHGTT